MWRFRGAAVLSRARLFAAIAAATTDPDACVGVLVVRTHCVRELENLFGYEVSDLLGSAMHDRLKEAIQGHDLAFRIGECDFAVVLPRLRQRQYALLAAGKIARSLQQPFELGGKPVHANAAVGVATWPVDGADPATLCRRADEASAEAWRLPERYAFNSKGPRQTVDYSALYEAIAGNRLQNWLQPLRNVADGRLVGFESLSRWHHDGVWVSPERFVVLAEEAGLIEGLTRWCVHGTLRHCAPLLRAHPELACAVNLSPRAILGTRISEQIDSALRLWDVPPHCLKVEITETAFVQDAAALAEALNELRDMGVRISIDDYGTGYSSLLYLRDFPVDEIKIDRSFVSDIPQHPRNARLTAAVVELGRSLGVRTVAEGVEDPEVLDMLMAMGCDHYQGYLGGRPRPAEEVVAEALGGTHDHDARPLPLQQP